MRRISVAILLVSLVFVFHLIGCAKQAATSQQAIESSKTLKTVDEQVKYLVSQANTFINSKQFEQAISTAQYILSNLDKNSQDAKGIIETAKAELAKVAEKAVADVRNKLGPLGK